jgi:SAM-dependent methyltransferase
MERDPVLLREARKAGCVGFVIGFESLRSGAIKAKGKRGHKMYAGSEDFYDKLYAFKDYRAEAEKVVRIVKERNPNALTLLDAACGSGSHLAFLKNDFRAEGLDISGDFVRLARAKNPGIEIHEGNLLNFSLERKYDAVTCLFSSIGYVRTKNNLNKAIANLARHLERQGLLLVEPWFVPEGWHPGTVHGLYINEPDLKIARVSTSQARKGESYMEMHYLVGTPEGTSHFAEIHRMGLFTREDMNAAFAGAGLNVEYIEEGITGRGLYIGAKA